MLENNKIVLVDDEVPILDMYRKILGGAGFQVFTAENGKVGFDLVLEERPSLILSDIVMPNTDGFSLLEKVKRNNKTRDIPVIMLTNLDNAHDRSEAVRLGASGYLVKVKLTPTQLSEKIKNIFINNKEEDQKFIE